MSAPELAGAVRRVAPFAGAQGTVLLEVGDAEVRVRAADQQFGEAEEAVKATTSGDRFTTTYQPRYLADALQAFGAQAVRIGLRSETPLDDDHRRGTGPVRRRAALRPDAEAVVSQSRSSPCSRR
ncbi:hypothetical protein [Saccharopolyspora sp. ASAGF58]|uniref:hypothetical protein n=1 Tax=Saccharopolyspora sp. ASAGF58 TaxID=2719023 RepID=UPI001FF0A412|nr:hypothetical protein [Saccharopolyspora sp. ASAGF58]